MESGTNNAQPPSPSLWQRGLFMLICAILYNIAEMVLVAVAISQFLFKLFTGNENQQLKTLGRGLSIFFYQTMQFLTFNSEEKPFPFSPWPDANNAAPLASPRKRSADKDER